MRDTSGPGRSEQAGHIVAVEGRRGGKVREVELK